MQIVLFQRDVHHNICSGMCVTDWTCMCMLHAIATIHVHANFIDANVSLCAIVVCNVCESIRIILCQYVLCVVLWSLSLRDCMGIMGTFCYSGGSSEDGGCVPGTVRQQYCYYFQIYIIHCVSCTTVLLGLWHCYCTLFPTLTHCRSMSTLFLFSAGILRLSKLLSKLMCKLIILA